MSSVEKKKSLSHFRRWPHFSGETVTSFSLSCTSFSVVFLFFILFSIAYVRFCRLIRFESLCFTNEISSIALIVMEDVFSVLS